jgi:electron transfer flavoprotein alpha subunit
VKIVCLVKQVPEVGAIQFDQATKTLRREGVPLELNPFDRFAVQHAVALRDAAGGEVVAMSMGPPQAEQALQETFALGADRAILLSDRVFAVADTLGTSRTLALALRKEGFDLVVCGVKSTDSETWQVPPEVAAFLGIPHLTNATAAEPGAGGELHVRRLADDADERWRVPMPALVSFAAPPDAEEAAARDDQIQTWTALDLVEAVEEYDKRFGQTGSPTRVLAVRTVTPERAQLEAETAAEARERVASLLAERAPAAPTWEKPPSVAEEPAASYDCWVLIETRDGRATRTSLELLARGRELAGKLGGRVVALALDPLDPGLGRYGAELVHRVRHDGDPAAALRAVLERHSPHVLLVPATAWGRHVGPRAAGELELGMTGDCVGVDIARAGRLLQQKPAYGGNIVSVIMGATTPQLATVRPRMYEPLQPRDVDAEGREEQIEAPSSGLELLDRQPHAQPGFRLDEADTVVVLAGAGTGITADAAVGYTLEVVERGDAPRHLHVGLLGRAVAPRLLVAVGVEGTVEQTGGFVKALVVVSVNGGDGMNERADVVLHGEPGESVDALLA